MEELLKFVEDEIKKARGMKLYTVDENGEEEECYDGECIFHDGKVSGLLSAYIEVKNKILELSK